MKKSFLICISVVFLLSLASCGLPFENVGATSNDDHPSFDSSDFRVSSELSDEMFNGQIQLIDHVYTLPFRFQELIDNGWYAINQRYDNNIEFAKAYNMTLHYNVDGKTTRLQFNVIGAEEGGGAFVDGLVYCIEFYAESITTIQSGDSYYNVNCPVAFPGGHTSYKTEQDFMLSYPDTFYEAGDEVNNYKYYYKPDYVDGIDTEKNLQTIGLWMQYMAGDNIYEYAPAKGDLHHWYYTTLLPVYYDNDGNPCYMEYPYTI